MRGRRLVEAGCDSLIRRRPRVVGLRALHCDAQRLRRRDLSNPRVIDVSCVEHELQQRERAHDLDPKGRAQRTHVRVVGDDADVQNVRVAENGDIDRRNAESVRVRLIRDEVDSGTNCSLLLPANLQSDLTIVSILGFINLREFAAQSPATGELPLEVLGEVEAGPVFPELDEQ